LRRAESFSESDHATSSKFDSLKRPVHRKQPELKPEVTEKEDKTSAMAFTKENTQEVKGLFNHRHNGEV